MKYIFLLLFLPLVAFAQGGNVILNGTIIQGGNPPASSFPAASAFDGNPVTWFASTTGGTWVGEDAGQAVTPVSVGLMPRPGNATTVFALATWSGCVIEATVSDPTFASPVLLYTVPSWNTGLPDILPDVMKYITLSPSTAYRYYRFRDPVSLGNLAEIRFIVQYASGLTATPVPPVI